MASNSQGLPFDTSGMLVHVLQGILEQLQHQTAIQISQLHLFEKTAGLPASEIDESTVSGLLRPAVRDPREAHLEVPTEEYSDQSVVDVDSYVGEKVRPEAANERSGSDLRSLHSSVMTMRASETLKAAVWNADDNVSVLFSEPMPKLPSGMNVHVGRLLLAMGVLPPQHCSASLRRKLYTAYQGAICAAWPAMILGRLFVLLLYSMETTAELVLMIQGSTDLILYFLLATWWWVVKREMRAHSIYMQMFIQLDDRGFPWSSLKTSTRVVGSTVVLLWSMMFAFWLEFGDVLSVLSGRLWIYIIAYIFIFGCTSLLSFAIPGLIWIVFFLAKLHSYDLLCYSNVVTAVLECSDLDESVVPTLSNLETTVTARLHRASTTWVRQAMVGVGILFLELLVGLMVAISDSVSVAGKLMFLCWFFICSLVALAVVLPLAMVAHTFEHDVLRALNRPSVLHGARRCLGNQMLPHLHTLGWGFRFCGSVITTRIIMQIATAVIVTGVVAVTRSILTEVGSSLETFKH